MANRSTAATVQLRTQQVAEMLLDGASRLEVIQFASEEWKVSERQVDNYIAKANEAIYEERAANVAHKRAKHVAMRERMARKAIKAGDTKLALTLLDSAANLEGLFVAKHEHEFSGSVETTALTPAEQLAKLQEMAD